MRARNDLVLLMKNRRVNGKQLAESTGISPAFISYIVNGRMVPTDDELEAICADLGVTPAQIYPDDSMREALTE